jgi:uncharacterized protein
MSQPKALYRLQKIDHELDSHRQRLRAVAAALKDDSALQQARADVAALENKLRPKEARVTDLKLEIQTINRQSTQLNDRLYSGTVSNPKELEDIQDKLVELKHRHAALEDEQLETMITVEELADALATARQHLSTVETQWAEQQDRLTQEQRQLKRAVKKLKADRQDALQAITPDNAALYEDLRAKKRRRAVAELEGESCSVCGVGQTTTAVQRVRRKQELVFCSSCGRILVAN